MRCGWLVFGFGFGFEFDFGFETPAELVGSCGRHSGRMELDLGITILLISQRAVLCPYKSKSIQIS
jgi:hypothetical protein